MERKLNEKAVLERLKENDSSAFEWIYNRYWEALFNHAYNYLRDENETKELIQDLFVELWQKRHALDIHTSLSGYLQSALRFKILNHVKASIVREKYAASIQRNKFVSHSHVEDEINYSELHTALHAALELLPAQPRRVYELRQNGGLSYTEIAESLRISVSTVEKHMIKALKHLRKSLQRFRNI